MSAVVGHSYDLEMMRPKAKTVMVSAYMCVLSCSSAPTELCCALRLSGHGLDCPPTIPELEFTLFSAVSRYKIVQYHVRFGL